MKSCLIFSAYLPDVLTSRGLAYLNLIQRYFNECDIYMGINEPYSSNLISLLPNFFKNITYGIVDANLSTSSDNSGYQKALKLLKDSGKTYDSVFMTHTKSITHPHDFENSIKYIELEFYKKIDEINKLFEENTKIGGWSFYGDVNHCPSNDTLDIYYDFKYKSLPIMYWLTSYVIRGNIVNNFIHNCNDNFFNSKYINRYFFEAYFPQIISKSGYIPYYENHWHGATDKDNKDKQYKEIINKELVLNKG